MDIYLVDGNAYVYRAFYAIRGLTDLTGRPTNAIYGFTNTLLKIIKERKPDAIAVSFDTPQPTERHLLFKDYKANRKETPGELIGQLPHIKRMLKALRIEALEAPGYEADDVLATVAERASQGGDDVYIVTSDKDMLQLLGDKIKVYDPVIDRVFDEAYVMDKLGVPPERVTEYMALAGDASDNIPGIKGIGEKTAKDLLKEFGSLDELIAHPERIKNERIRKLVSENTDAIRLSKRLAEINRQVPLEFAISEFALKEPDWKGLAGLYKEFNFTSLIKLIPAETPTEKECEVVLTLEDLKDRLGNIQSVCSFDLEAIGSGPVIDEVVGFSVCLEKDNVFYVPLLHSYDGAPYQAEKKQALDALGVLLQDANLPKVGHDLKSDILLLDREGILIKGVLYDTMLASYLLNPVKADHSLEGVCLDYLSIKKKSLSDITGSGSFDKLKVEAAAGYSCDKAGLTYELKGPLFEKLREQGLEKLYLDIEMPLIYVLADMEKAGIKIDAEKLNKLSEELGRELDSIQRRIFFFSGVEFNINSPKQLGKVLFEDLGLKPGKKKKTGYSTDVSVLEELSKTHELPREVLNYRGLYKLKATYVDTLPALINPRTGRLHTSFNQAATATGRLSSSEPNLQNIPIRGEWGKRIREAFIAEDGNVLIAADYSQIELRVMAHMSRDKALIDAFIRGDDVHSMTASEVFGVPSEKVTGEMRRTAKTVNFGILYGITPFGLSESLGVSKEDAGRYINRYFERHPGVREYIDNVLSTARKEGVVRTLFGRTRPVPELTSANSLIRQSGERLTVNAPIQGTAADIIKIAMINISKRLAALSKSEVSLILQVHDELVFEVPEAQAEEAARLIKEEMEGAADLIVPIKVDIVSGKNWGALDALYG